MKKNYKKAILKILIIIIVLAFVTAVTIYLFPIIKGLTTVEGQTRFKEISNKSWLLGMIVLFLLQLSQVIVALLPGEPMEVLAGMFYGYIGGTILIIVYNFIISAFIFWLTRRYGKKVIYFFFNKKKVDKFLESKIFKNTKRIETILFFLFLIPGTPKDLLIYVGGLLPVSPISFLIISNLARFPSILSSTIVGSNIVNGNWKICALVYLITFAFVCITYILIRIFDKNNEITKAINK